jgi:hypothetical protein
MSRAREVRVQATPERVIVTSRSSHSLALALLFEPIDYVAGNNDTS